MSDDAYVYNDKESLLAQVLGLSKETAKDVDGKCTCKGKWISAAEVVADSEKMSEEVIAKGG